MTATEREKLFSRESEYLSIGITDGGIPRKSIGVPWVSTAHAFNMRLPNVYLSPSDLSDGEIMEKVRSFKVIGCYIWVPLDDYSFLAELKDLQDITIRCGDALRELDFLARLTECRMLYLQNAKLKDLNVIFEMKKRGRTVLDGIRCLALDNCEVEDLSVFEGQKIHMSELLILNPEGKNERDRWRVISAITFRYWEFRE